MYLPLKYIIRGDFTEELIRATLLAHESPGPCSSNKRLLAQTINQTLSACKEYAMLSVYV